MTDALLVTLRRMASQAAANFMFVDHRNRASLSPPTSPVLSVTP